jgi:hypothetical protein
MEVTGTFVKADLQRNNALSVAAVLEDFVNLAEDHTINLYAADKRRRYWDVSLTMRELLTFIPGKEANSDTLRAVLSFTIDKPFKNNPWPTIS